MNGSFGLGWLELQGPENMEWTMHAKQRNPSRIQAQEVAQKGPECDAKVCLTRPSNPLKTLGPGLNSCLTFVSRPCMRNGAQMKKKLTVQWTAMAASASVGLNFRAPRTWSGRCMRNSETPARFKPKRWPKKVPNATPRCA